MGKGSCWKAKGDGRPEGIKRGCGPWNEYTEDSLGGTCLACGSYEQELDKDGFCRREGCRHARIVQALQTGEARMLADGTFLWTPGVQSFVTEGNNTQQAFKKCPHCERMSAHVRDGHCDHEDCVRSYKSHQLVRAREDRVFKCRPKIQRRR
jgi:hypothetical protein